MPGSLACIVTITTSRPRMSTDAVVPVSRIVSICVRTQSVEWVA